MGVWLPLALADIAALLTKTVQMWAINPGDITIPKRSETLAAWALPFLASSLNAAEKEAEAKENHEKAAVLRATLRNIQAKYGNERHL